MKKILSLILAMAMILSSFSFAFAVPSDVEGTDYENAVARLSALDIIVGYEDGTFRPDNSITRAEFAAIAVRALGMEDIAAGSAANTKFPDVSANHWASGYVNLATAQGIIVGYPDGTFKPEAQVTYSEAVAMLVRLLGYEPALNSNEWPSNYLTKASEIGLTLGIKFNYNDPAKRGVVSVLTNKALDIDLMDLAEVTSGDRTWKITDDTLLTKYLNVFELEDAQVVETASHSLTKLDADEVKIGYDDKTYTFKMIDLIDADALLGHEVTVFVRDTDTDGKVEDDELVISIQDTIIERDEFYVDADEITDNMFVAAAAVEVATGSGITGKIVNNNIELDGTVIAKWNSIYEKLEDFADGYTAEDFTFVFDKFEIVSGGIDTKNGIIEVMVAGTDEDEDMTWFVHVDKYGNESFYYDVDTSHRNLENKILSLEDLADGDMIHIYDVPEETVTEYIAIYDR